MNAGNEIHGSHESLWWAFATCCLWASPLLCGENRVRYIRIVTEDFDTTRFEEKLLASCLWRGAFRLVEGRSFSFSYLHESYRIQRVVPPPEIAWKWPRVKVNKSELSIGTWGETVFWLYHIFLILVVRNLVLRKYFPSRKMMRRCWRGTTFNSIS